MEVVIEVLRYLHSWTRWLVVGIAVVAVVYFAVRLATRGNFDILSARLMTAFTGLISLQWLIGIVLLVVLGSMTGFGVRHYWEHLVTMTVAVGVASLHFRWRRLELAPTARYGRLLGV
ncbi:MAG: hypothetical protein CUN53_10760, partial [Phototrophicales bacterium]